MKQNESKLQQGCVTWFRLQYPDKIIYAIPNGGSRNVLEAVNLKKQGTLSGVADLHIPISNGKYHSLFLESKFGKNKQTESQVEFQQKVEKFGNCYKIFYSFDEFKKIIENYLK